ncbi:LysR family transcriptional regulator [Corticibacterium sp. UT-5YL-CI-8]|nr:LysR family transcriptional regulator [Tianweitania sp. UT-5YL-CI-8]
MELRQLRYFLAVASEGTYGRASQKLNVAQPALSRQIQKLEQELGAMLFVRHSHGVSLTAAAIGIQARAQHILDEVSVISRTAREGAAALRTIIRIGVSPGTAEILAYPLSKLVMERFPDFRCEIVSMLMPARTELLRAGKVAFALMNAPGAMEGLRITPLMRERLCLICRNDDVRFSGNEIELEQLSAIPLVIGGPSGSGVRSILDRAFNDARLRLRTIAEVNTAGASKALVMEGLGPTVHVAAMARAEIQRGELRAIPIRALHSVRVLACASDTPLRNSLHELMDAVRDCLRDLVANGRWPNGEMLPG